MRRALLQVVAGIVTVVQLIFAGVEIFGWGPQFVARAAPSWVDHKEAAAITPQMQSNIDWAGKLACNMGVYNLVLAIGLGWLAFGGRRFASPLGLFLAIWLIVAGAAGGLTGVNGALYLQGGLGLALLWATVDALRHPLA